jgi:hypothetical protein
MMNPHLNTMEIILRLMAVQTAIEHEMAMSGGYYEPSSYLKDWLEEERDCYATLRKVGYIIKPKQETTP